MDAGAVLDEVRRIATRFAAERQERQRRRELDPGDFDELGRAGILLTGVAAPDGGLFDTVSHSTRPIAEILRTLARGDPSVALVCSMHPGRAVVLAGNREGRSPIAPPGPSSGRRSLLWRATAPGSARSLPSPAAAGPASRRSC